MTQAEINGQAETHSAPQQRAGVHSPVRGRWALTVWLVGYFLPVVVGIIVRTVLKAAGKPVLEWSWILEPARIIQFAIFLAYWSVSFALVAWLATPKRLAAHGPALAIGAFIGTFTASVLVFADLWKNIEAVVIGALLVPFFVLPGTLAGLVLGWIAARISGRKRQL